MCPYLKRFIGKVANIIVNLFYVVGQFCHKGEIITDLSVKSTPNWYHLCNCPMFYLLNILLLLLLPRVRTCP